MATFSWLTLCCFCFYFFGCFRAAPAAYGSSQARGPVGATAAGLYHSHSNATRDPSQICHLHYSSWKCQILNPLSKDRDPTGVLMDASWVRLPLSHARWELLVNLHFSSEPIKAAVMISFKCVSRPSPRPPSSVPYPSQGIPRLILCQAHNKRYILLVK